jgi:hypothetical protein
MHTRLAPRTVRIGMASCGVRARILIRRFCRIRSARVLAGLGSGDGPRSIRVRPSSLKRDCDRRTTSIGEKCLVDAHAKSRLTLEPLRTLQSETKGQAGACPDRTRAIPCMMQAVTEGTWQQRQRPAGNYPAAPLVWDRGASIRGARRRGVRSACDSEQPTTATYRQSWSLDGCGTQRASRH